jgi:hypothetical protein
MYSLAVLKRAPIVPKSRLCEHGRQPRFLRCIAEFAHVGEYLPHRNIKPERLHRCAESSSRGTRRGSLRGHHKLLGLY